MSIPSHLRYTSSHEWLSIDGDLATVGITDFAADALGDVVFVGLPKIGDELTVGDVCGEIESTKSVSDLYSPVTGRIVDVNETLSNESGLVNTDPYGAGWLFRIRVGNVDDFLDAAAYAALVGKG
jgi:glycine cleavage system H protein